MRLIGTLFGFVALVPASMTAQPVVLKGAAARLNHQFSVVRGLRELPDGRVLIADGIDNVLVRADFASQRLDTIGRAGQGPGEYKSPDQLFPMPAGGTLLMDLGNGRLSLIDAAAKFTESFSMALGTPGAGGFALVVPRGTDDKGRIYFQPMGGGPQADSAPIVRWDRASKKFDTVARVKLPKMIVKSSGTANNRRESMRQAPYPMQEAWTTAPDGRVAVVRAPVYRVDWFGPDRSATVGPAVAVPGVPIRDAEKKEYLAETGANAMSVAVTNNNGSIAMRFSRGRSRDTDDEPEEQDLGGDEWPATKPAFTGLTAIDAAGQLWVERSVPAAAPRVYDVFGPKGNVVRQVSLPAGRRLLAVGTKGLYARHIDSDGINYLERFDLK